MSAAATASPVLLLVFNRPDTTARVFEAIRRARPPRLYVAADGARAGKPGEAERCTEVRRIATAVDWPCELRTLFRDANLGCKQGVSQGISWFFEQEAEGIVLEDDVLPQSSFFAYCDELLARYRDEPRVAVIGGCNLIEHKHRVSTSYYFSVLNHVWGWASWRRAWQGYDVEMRAWPRWRDSGALLAWLHGNRCAADYWSGLFERMHRREIDTWDFQWTFHCWQQRGLTAQPAHSLVTNLGFGPDATHTVKDAPLAVRRMRPRELTWPLKHPAQVSADVRADQLIQRHIFGLGPWRCLRRALRRRLNGLFA